MEIDFGNNKKSPKIQIRQSLNSIRIHLNKNSNSKKKKKKNSKVKFLQFVQILLDLKFYAFIKIRHSDTIWSDIFFKVSKWSGRSVRSKSGPYTREASETCARANTIHLNPIILADYWLDSVCSLCRWSRLTLSLPCLVRLHIYIINYITLLIIIFTLAEYIDTYATHKHTLHSDIP